MLKVGLTGNIAAGKSAVARVWARLGAQLIDADLLARNAVEPGTRALREIEARWGPAVLDQDGRLDRAALRDIVFRNPTERTRLEQIIHPAVAEMREREYERLRRAGVSVAVADIPLLFEVGLESEFDIVVLVDAAEEVRRGRIVRDRGLDPDEADRMIAAQLPSAEKRHRAHMIIDNEGSLQDLEARAAEVWRAIEAKAAEGHGRG